MEANLGPPVWRTVACASSGTVVQGVFRYGLWHLPSAHDGHGGPGHVTGAAIQPKVGQRLNVSPYAKPASGQPASGVHAVRLPAAVSGTLGAAGERLPPSLQRHMEAALGADFGDVRVNVGPQAASIGALAFAHGDHLYLAPGQYNPSTQAGQHLLAHELTHVVQQRAGRVRNPFGRGIAIVNDPALEAEANQTATRTASGAALVLQAKPQEAGGGNEAQPRGGFPTRDIGRLHRKTGGTEKDIFLLEQGKAAAVSKTGDLRRIQEEVRTLHSLSDHAVPTIQASDVMMFRQADRISPGFIVDWIPNTIDSNADPAGFQSALQRLRPEMRRAANRDLNKIEGFVNRFGGIQDLQVLLDITGHLRVLDPRGETDDPTGSLQLIQNWRATVGG